MNRNSDRRKKMQTGATEVVGPRAVVHDLTVATRATVLEVDKTNEDTIFDELVRDLDQMVEDITSDHRWEMSWVQTTLTVQNR